MRIRCTVTPMELLQASWQPCTTWNQPIFLRPVMLLDLGTAALRLFQQLIKNLQFCGNVITRVAVTCSHQMKSLCS